MLTITDFGETNNFPLYEEDRRKLEAKMGYSSERIKESAIVVYQHSDIPIFTLVRGQEIRTPQGDVLAIAPDQRVPTDRSLSYTLECMRDQGSIIIPPHPFTGIHSGIGRKNLEENLEFWDAIETFNAQNICLFPIGPLNQTQSNNQAEDFAEQYDKAKNANSDAHRQITEIARSHTYSAEQIDFTTLDRFQKTLRLALRDPTDLHEEHSSKYSFLKWAVPLYAQKIRSKFKKPRT